MIFSLYPILFIYPQGPHHELLVGSEIQYTLAELSFLKRAIWSGFIIDLMMLFFYLVGVIFDAWKMG